MIEKIKKRVRFLAGELDIDTSRSSELISRLDEVYNCGSIDVKSAVNAIDHTVLSFNATEKDIDRVCADAGKFDFKAICINPVWVKKAFDIRKENGSRFLIATVIDFPLGASTLSARISETKQAVADGADEIDIVINIGLLKSGMIKETYQNLKEVIAAIKSYYKIILETSELSVEEKIDAAVISVFAGADMLKTSTGVNGKASVEDVRLLRMIAGSYLGVKAAGGIRDKATLVEMMKAGADRIGCSSSVNIINSW
ncbi:MAG TPA: deoxyribose-phosphate aldolase [bacterium]|nr:deoxyribose-phosphate aldolase [bacterium]